MNTRADAEKKTIAVLYGGQSSEHSVSCISAGAIMSHLDPDKYSVVPIGITRDGEWVKGESDYSKLSAQGNVLPEVSPSETTLTLALGSHRTGEIIYLSGDHAGEVFARVDVVFPVLHGLNGEDGTVQGFLDLAGVAYVGNGVLSSAASMDKDFTKRIATGASVPVGREVILHAEQALTQENKEYLGLPVFVKPARGGSSIGISKVSEWDGFDDALALARKHDRKVIVESMLTGSEVECGVLQREDGILEVSQPAVLSGTEDGDEGFYDFDTKYLDDVVSAQIGGELSDATVAEVQALALRTFEALGCEGLARVDFFVTQDGPVLNEINTMPGFTPISMYPQMFAASGIDYPTLLDILISRELKAQR